MDRFVVTLLLIFFVSQAFCIGSVFEPRKSKNAPRVLMTDDIASSSIPPSNSQLGETLGRYKLHNHYNFSTKNTILSDDAEGLALSTWIFLSLAVLILLFALAAAFFYFATFFLLRDYIITKDSIEAKEKMS